MKLLVLSHLLLSGEKSVGELARLLGISNTYASQVTDNLAEDGFVVKERKGKRVVVRPNMESPFVRSFSKFAVIVGAYPPYTPTDFLEPESKRKIIWRLREEGKSIEALARDTGYSRTVIYDALRPFIKSGVVSSGEGKRKIFSVNNASPLTEPLFQVIEFFESDIDLRPVLERISSDEKVVALSVFGSQVFGEKDRLSDVDALIVVRSPKDRDISKEYVYPRLQLNIYSRKGIIHLARREPWFLKLALDGKIVKGRDFLEGLVGVPVEPDFETVTSEIREMLDNLDRLPNKEKARILMYCIRTAVAMRLFLERTLDQSRFMEELRHRYPELSIYRAEVKKMDERVIRRSKGNILEDMTYVEKKEKTSAEKLEAQARAHEALYGSDWKEVTEYRRQAREIIDKYDLRPNDKRVDAEELKVFKKRLKDFEEGKRRMRGELPFTRVLRLLSEGGAVNPNDETEVKNLQMLEMLGYIKDGKLTWKGRDMMKRIKR